MILCNVVQLCDGILERCPGHLASFFWISQHLILEHGVVESQTEADRMSHCQSSAGHLRSLLVRLAGILCSLLLGITILEFGHVTIIIGLHLVVEDLSLIAGGFLQKVTIQKRQNGVANSVQFLLDLTHIFVAELGILGVAFRLLLLLDAGDDAPCRAAASDSVFVCHRKKVTLLNGKLLRNVAHLFHVIGHLVISLSLLGELSEVHRLLTTTSHWTMKEHVMCLFLTQRAGLQLT